MLGSAITGFLAAVVVFSVFIVQDRLPGTAHHAVLILGLTVIAALVQWAFIDRKPAPRTYHGLSDMLVQIHSPSTADVPSRWAWKGLISYALACITGSAGPEGVACEWNYAISLKTRPRSARWFEQRRRTDAASVLSAGIAAAFGTPFAAILVPIELGIGGRALSSVICALTAFLGVKLASAHFAVQRFDLSGSLDAVDLSLWKGWIALVAVSVGSGLLGAMLLRFIRFSRRELRAFAPRAVALRILLGGGFLFLLAVVYPLSSVPTPSLLQDLFFNRMPASESGILFFSKSLSLVLVLVGFGTIGVFWPVFALGGILGFAVNHFVFQNLMQSWFSGIASFAPMAAVAGAAALWAAMLGTPVAGAVLILELTDQITPAILCLVVGLGANAIARRFARSLPEQELEGKGIHLVEGRSLEILESLRVSDIMMTDIETIHEKESLKHLAGALVASRYPFLPVVREDNIYTGLVTIDMLQDRVSESSEHTPLDDLFEVRDLLYRSGFKTKVVRASDRLSATRGLFLDIPCVPVLSDDGRIAGLLFVHHVRLAYDREVARRSLQIKVEAPESAGV